MAYREQLYALHQAVLHRAQDNAISFIARSRDDILVEERLAVYIDGYTHRLIQAVFSHYPTSAHVMSEEVLRAQIQQFVSETLSSNWDLNFYAPRFGVYCLNIDMPKPYQEMAQLEAAIADVFWMKDSNPLTAGALAGLDEQAFARATLSLRTASCLMQFSHDVNRYLTVFRECGRAEPLIAKREYLLVVRHKNQLQRHILEADEYAILSALHQAVPFSEALEAVEDAYAVQHKLPDYISRWLEHGFFQAL